VFDPDEYPPRLGLSAAQEVVLCLYLMEEAITKGLNEGVAAIMVEPIMGNGGHIVHAKAYHEGLLVSCELVRDRQAKTPSLRAAA
jgi:glutamate-1-semialdehyde aminotransferase